MNATHYVLRSSSTEFICSTQCSLPDPLHRVSVHDCQQRRYSGQHTNPYKLHMEKCAVAFVSNTHLFLSGFSEEICYNILHKVCKE